MDDDEGIQMDQEPGQQEQQEKDQEEGEIPNPIITTTSAALSPSAQPSPPSPPSSTNAPPAPTIITTHLAVPSTSTAPASSSPLKNETSSLSFDEYEEVQDPFEDEESPAFKASKSASQWNGLLRWARKSRGPQWDWATGMYHVDTSSPEYFANVTRLPEGATPAPNTNIVLPSGSTFGDPGTPNYESTSGRPRRSRAAMSGR
ncbi:hypothetical protein T439DRAFT_323361 [Meredithblackwellia eburnea MCA 4105]